MGLQSSFALPLLTGGGPDRATMFLPIYSFASASSSSYGYASAMMLLGFAACLAVGVLQYLVVRRWRLGLTGSGR